MTGERLGIFGGTFNPPHNGHVHAAREASQALDMRVLFIPDNIPPHKRLPRGSASARDRLEMTRLAALEVEGSQVLDIELRRRGKSYTADTVEQLSQMYPGSELWLIVGTDMLCTMDTWYKPERIFEKAGIAALARNDGDSPEIAESAEYLREKYGARIELIEAQPLPVSSSQIRALPYDQMRSWLPHAVFEYIEERGLYLGVRA